MKKLLFFIATAALMLSACSGNKQQKAEAEAAAEQSAKEQQIRAGMSAALDSLTTAFMRVRPFPMFDKNSEGTVVLSDDEKKVAPDYLINPEDIINKLETLSLKYRALFVFMTDAQVGKIYEMADIYSDPIARVMADVNDPAIKFYLENDGKMEREAMMKEVYRIEEETGRANYFWESMATAMVEQLYIIGQNQEKFLASFTDKDAEDITWHLSILLDAYKELAEYNADLGNLFNVLKPLRKLNAITVDEFRKQLTQVRYEVEQARATLFI